MQDYTENDQFKTRLTQLLNGFDIGEIKISRPVGGGIVYVAAELKSASSMSKKLTEIGKQISEEFNLRYVTVRVTRRDFLFQFVTIQG